MNTVTSLIWLRWRLIANGFYPELFSLSKFFGLVILLAIILLFSAFGIASGLVLVEGYQEGIEATVNKANTVIIGITVFVLWLKVLYSGKLARQFSLSKFKHFPIRPTVLRILNLLIGLLDVWYIILFGFLLGFISGTGLLTISVHLMLPSVLVAFSNVALLHFCVELLSWIGRSFTLFSRFPKYVISGVILAGLITLIINEEPLPEAISIDTLTMIVQFVPLGWMNNALYSVIFDQSTEIFVIVTATTVLLVAACFGILLVLWNFESKITPVQARSSRSKEGASRGWLEKVFSLPPRELTPYLTKDILYLVRSRRTQTLIVLSSFFLLVFVFATEAKVELFSRQFFLIPFLTLMPMLWEQYYINYFGMEKSSFSLYLFTPTKPLFILLSKNVSFLLVTAPFILFLWVDFGMRFSSSLLVLLILSQCSVFWIPLIIGNFSSINVPTPVEAHEFPTWSRSNFSTFSFINIVIALVMLTFIAFAIWYFSTSHAIYILILGPASLGSVTYGASLFLASRKFISKREFVHSKLSQQ